MNSNLLPADSRAKAARGGGRAFSEIDIWNLGYIALVSLLILVCRKRISHWPLCLAAYVGVGFFLAGFLRATAGTTRPSLVFVRAWYTPLLFIFHYEFTFALNQALAPLYAPLVERAWPGVELVSARIGGRVYFDEILLAADRWLFGFQPSIRFAWALGSNWFGELMNLCYFSFYLFIPVTGLVLWLQGRREAFDDFLFRATFVMWICCVVFIAFPTAGPRHFLGPEEMNLGRGYLFAWIMRLIFLNAEVPTGGFPSSHVAVTASILISAFRYERRLFAALFPFFIGLCFSTVYVAEHYAVDALAGLVAGPILYALAPWARRALGRAVGNAALVAQGLETGSD